MSDRYYHIDTPCPVSLDEMEENYYEYDFTGPNDTFNFINKSTVGWVVFESEVGCLDEFSGKQDSDVVSRVKWPIY